MAEKITKKTGPARKSGKKAGTPKSYKGHCLDHGDIHQMFGNAMDARKVLGPDVELHRTPHGVHAAKEMVVDPASH